MRFVPTDDHLLHLLHLATEVGGGGALCEAALLLSFPCYGGLKNGAS